MLDFVKIKETKEKSRNEKKKQNMLKKYFKRDKSTGRVVTF